MAPLVLPCSHTWSDWAAFNLGPPPTPRNLLLESTGYAMLLLQRQNNSPPRANSPDESTDMNFDLGTGMDSMKGGSRVLFSPLPLGKQHHPIRKSFCMGIYGKQQFFYYCSTFCRSCQLELKHTEMQSQWKKGRSQLSEGKEITFFCTSQELKLFICKSVHR